MKTWNSGWQRTQWPGIYVYLHDGGVRTLETLFSSSFATHYGALAPNFLTEAEPARS
jgi:hypothetical protein